MPSETFKQLAKRYPERVGNAGYSADIDGYQIAVVDMGRDYQWSLSLNNRYLESGTAIAPALAWLRACDALDVHRAACEVP